MSASQIIRRWPKESQEAAKLVLEKYGEPDEASESQLTWHKRGPWKRPRARPATPTGA